MKTVEWSEEMSRIYASYMERNVKHDHRRFAARIAVDCGPLPPSALVVDVAGGPGFLAGELAPHFKGARFVVVDDSLIMNEVATERAQGRGLPIEVQRASSEQLPFGDAEVDLVVCKHYLRFAKDLGAVLRECRRVLKPAGRAYFIDFNAEGPYLLKRLLWLWIRYTAPFFLVESFWDSMQQGLAATKVRDELLNARFSEATVLRSSVSYLIRAVR